MPKFIALDAANQHNHSARPARVNVDQIAFVTTHGDQHDPSSPAVITFAGGTPADRLIVTQTVDQVSALIDAAS
jgi:hypothetical protein